MSQSTTDGRGRDHTTSTGLDDKQGNTAPSSQLELYDGIINPDATDSVVEKLGTGYYTEDEQWQQIGSYRRGMYGDAAFGRGLYTRAVHETIMALGREGWQWYDEDRESFREMEGADLEDVQPRESPRNAVFDRGKRIWDQLGAEQPMEGQGRLAALQEHSGLGGEWMPPHWRMMEARHEASKSRDARTQDNAFGTRQDRTVEHKGENGGTSSRWRRTARRNGGESR